MDKWVPHELNKNHERKRFEMSSAFLLCNQNYLFHNRIKTCDEKWFLYDSRKRSAQWLNAAKTPQHFPELKFREKKVMVTVWRSPGGLIHHSFIKPGETTTAEKHCTCREIDETRPYSSA